MSDLYGGKITTHCFNDCRQTGCPKHIVTIIRHGASDVLTIEIDGRREYSFDINIFEAAIESYRKLKEKYDN